MKTIFDKIIEGTVPAHIIYQDDQTLAFLDYNPVTPGHCLVVPRQAVDHLDDCSEELYQAIFATVHRVSRLLKEKLGPERIGMVVHGYEIPHAHVHVLPIYHHDDLKFPKRPEARPDEAALAAVAQKLTGAES